MGEIEKASEQKTNESIILLPCKCARTVIYEAHSVSFEIWCFWAVAY